MALIFAVNHDTRSVENLTSAAEACRILIRAYANDPEDVDWSDVQDALEEALRAFGLPDDYPEQVHHRETYGDPDEDADENADD